MNSTTCVEWAADHVGLSMILIHHFWKRYARKTIFHFRSHWAWPLTVRPQICSISYSCPALCFH